MPKTYGDVWKECQNLTRVECRVYMLYHDKMPAEDEICSPETALLLYLADILKFERMDTNSISLLLRHFHSQLREIATRLDQGFEERSVAVPVFRLDVLDGRYVQVRSPISPHETLDLETGYAVVRSSDIRTVTYNLTTLMLRRWATAVSPRIQTPESTDGDTPEETAGGS